MKPIEKIRKILKDKIGIVILTNPKFPLLIVIT